MLHPVGHSSGKNLWVVQGQSPASGMDTCFDFRGLWGIL